MGLSVTMLMPLSVNADWTNQQVSEMLTNIGTMTTDIGTISSSNDISRTELANALINYQAQLAIKNYTLQEEKMFMAAPGSPDAIQAGLDAGELAADVKSNAKVVSQTAVAAGLPVAGGSLLSSSALTSKSEPYLLSGNAEQLGPFNAATMLQEDVVQMQTSQELINIITNPTPSPLAIVKDPITGEINWGAGGTDRDKIADRLIEQSLMSVAANSLGEMAARRVVDPSTNKSFAQILRDEGGRRFADEEWYKNVGISSQEALLREIAQMDAYRTMLQYQQYRLQEQNASLLAAMLSSIAKMSGAMNMLNKQMQQSIPSADELKDIASEIELPEDFDPDDYNP